MKKNMIGVAIGLGIATLGLTASPSNAATATLGYYFGPNIPAPDFDWDNTVTLAGSGGTSVWKDAHEMQDVDNNGNFTEVLDHAPPSNLGGGTYDLKWVAALPASGHSYSVFMIDTGKLGVPQDPGWSVTTSSYTLTNNDGQYTVSNP